MKSLTRFVDTAVILAVTTAGLYFWGYVYYTAFCERLGLHFHGYTLSIQDYLVAGWQAVVYGMLAISALIFVFFALISPLVNWIIQKLEKPQSTSPRVKKQDDGSGYILLSAVILYLLLFIVTYAQYMIKLGYHDADEAKKEERLVIIRDMNGAVLKDCEFVYLRDMSSALLVAEISNDHRTCVGFRVLKSGSYGSYTILGKLSDKYKTPDAHAEETTPAPKK